MPLQSGLGLTGSALNHIGVTRPARSVRCSNIQARGSVFATDSMGESIFTLAQRAPEKTTQNKAVHTVVQGHPNWHELKAVISSLKRNDKCSLRLPISLPL